MIKQLLLFPRMISSQPVRTTRNLSTVARNQPNALPEGFDRANFKIKAHKFFELHHQTSELFVLPNAWDALSAKFFEPAGAIGTTSAGIAATFGYPDGEEMPRSVMLMMAERIVSSVEAPVSVDIESGYGQSLEEVVETVSEVIELGAVGINIEDVDPTNPNELCPVDIQVEKIKAIRQLVNEYDLPFFINARTDTFLRGIGSNHDQRVENTEKRLLAYRDAGADGMFVPGLTDMDIASQLKSSVKLPLNLLAGEWIESTSKLQSYGINRVSVGSGVFRYVAGQTEKLAQQTTSKELKDFKYMTDAINYDRLQDVLTNTSR